MKRRLSSINKYVLYSIIFFAYAALHLYFMYKNNRIAFNCTDGQTQFFPAMQYIRQLIIDFMTSIIHNTDYTFPMIEWTLAMGEDTIGALNYYGLGNPLYLFSAFVKEDYLPYFFNFLLYFQIYLGGISFIAFVNMHAPGKSPYAYVIGALLYTLSGFTYQCDLYYTFAHAMILTPLMLSGTYRSITGKKKGVLCISVFLYALCGFYYLYVSSLSIAVYTVYIFIQNKMKLKEAIMKIKDLLIEYTAGIGLSAFLFIPAVIGYLNCSRTTKPSIKFFLSVSAAKKFFIHLFFPNDIQTMSVSAIGVFVLVWLMLAKGKYKEKRNIIFMFFLCLFQPASLIMSGGKYYSRWQIVFIIYIGYLLVCFWDEIDSLSKLQKAASVLLLFLSGIYGKKTAVLGHERYRIIIFSCIVITGMTVIVLPLLKRAGREKTGMFLMFAAAAITIIQGWRVAASDFALSEIYDREVVSELVKNEEDGFFRIENERTAQAPFTAMNLGFSQGYHGISGYFSILNGSYTGALKKWNVSNADNYHTYGLRSRAVLESLCAVKYVILKNTENLQIPYGCVLTDTTSDNAWILCENQNALPLVYTYPQVFDKNLYAEMTGFEKQQVMLQAAAVENYQGTIDVSAEYDNHMKQLPYLISELKDAVITDNAITVQNGSVLKITAPLKKNCENYLVIKTGNCDFSISFSDDKYPNKTIVTRYDNGTSGADLGQVNWTEMSEVTLIFKNDAVFNTDDLELWYYDFTGYDANIRERKQGVENVEVSANTIKSRINLNQESIVCIAAPYNKGWSAKIDGEKAKIYKMNDMFMGVEVSSGTHLLELQYCTSGLRAGMMISLFTFSAIIINIYRNRYHY